jgi:hypothetical protein
MPELPLDAGAARRPIPSREIDRAVRPPRQAAAMRDGEAKRGGTDPGSIGNHPAPRRRHVRRETRLPPRVRLGSTSKLRAWHRLPPAR